MDKLKAMRAFVRIVETGSFTRAAESLCVPRPQVTRMVQSLERDLGTLLLHRTTRRVALTPEGTLYFHLAAQVLDDIHALETQLSEALGRPRGRRSWNGAAATPAELSRPAPEKASTDGH